MSASDVGDDELAVRSGVDRRHACGARFADERHGRARDREPLFILDRARHRACGDLTEDGTRQHPDDEDRDKPAQEHTPLHGLSF